MWGIVVFMAPQAAIGELLMPQLSFIYLFMLSLIASTGKLKKSICQMGRWLGIAANCTNRTLFWETLHIYKSLYLSDENEVLRNKLEEVERDNRSQQIEQLVYSNIEQLNKRLKND